MLIETNIFKSLKKAYKNILPQKDFLNVTVMLSAGVDSVALAHFAVKNKHLLTRLFNTKDININFYHFNHKLRPQNELMEQKAKELYEQRPWDMLRRQRDNRMKEVDWVTLRAMRTGESISDEWQKYMQDLADITSTSTPVIVDGELLGVNWPERPDGKPAGPYRGF